VNGTDSQLHYLSAKAAEDKPMAPSMFNANTTLPAAKKREVSHGDTLYTISRKYTVPLPHLMAANPHLKNPDMINSGDEASLPETKHMKLKQGKKINIPTQGYIVKSGDTLSKIAATNNISFPALLALNSEITNPDHITSGENIKMPSGATRDSESQENKDSISKNTKHQTPQTIRSDGAPYTVTVTEGDTLSKITKQNYVNINTLKNINKQIKNYDLIYPGDVINIPKYSP